MLSLRIDRRALSQVQRVARAARGIEKQVRFGSARALTVAGRKIAEYEGARTQTELDRPTPFTIKAFGATTARKDTLKTSVYAKDIQAEYLKRLVFGGDRTSGIVVPVDYRLNKYGNIPGLRGGKVIDRLAGRADYFAGRPKWGNTYGPAGVWQRIGKGTQRRLKLILAFEDRAEYQRETFPFFQIARDAWDRAFRNEFSRDVQRFVAQAFATAR